MKLYLIGLPGSGKSTLGKQLAEEARIPFIDLDRSIEDEAGSPVSKIFSEKGEDYFRNLEAVALRQQSKSSAFVMACGGGTPCFHNNMKFMNETGKSIFLNTSVAEIINRLNSTELQTRPLLANLESHDIGESLENLLRERLVFYTQANIVLTTTTPPSEILTLLKSKANG